MTSPKLLLPLRIPELGPSMGKVVAGTGRDPGGLRLDAFRYRLATRLFEHAGEARRLAAREERQAAVAAIGRVAWQEAWEEAVAGVADLVADRIATSVSEAARAVGLPRRRLRRVGLGEADRHALAARLGSAGAALVSALDAVEARAGAAIAATALERDAVEAWQEALTTAARRLDAAWLAVEDAVEEEIARWDAVAAEIASWRKPLWPVFVVGVLALSAAVWLGLVFGGYVEAPPAFADAWRRVVGP